jgi:hypothetical protein
MRRLGTHTLYWSCLATGPFSAKNGEQVAHGRYHVSSVVVAQQPSAGEQQAESLLNTWACVLVQHTDSAASTYVHLQPGVCAVKTVP